jgi:hypothetical protein
LVTAAHSAVTRLVTSTRVVRRQLDGQRRAQDVGPGGHGFVVDTRHGDNPRTGYRLMHEVDPHVHLG